MRSRSATRLKSRYGTHYVILLLLRCWRSYGTHLYTAQYVGRLKQYLRVVLNNTQYHTYIFYTRTRVYNNMIMRDVRVFFFLYTARYRRFRSIDRPIPARGEIGPNDSHTTYSVGVNIFFCFPPPSGVVHLTNNPLL